MKSASDYKRDLDRLGLTRLEIEVSFIPEAREALKQVRNAQKQLRQIKREINLDLKAIRAEYKQRSANAASGSSAALTIMGKRKLAGQVRADAKRQQRQERDSIIQPYDNLKFTIDDLLLQMDVAKGKIQKFIEDAKAEEQAKVAARLSKIEALLTLHLKTPPPDTPPSFSTKQFDVPEPNKPPNNANYPVRKPSPPILKDVNMRAKLFSGYRRRIEEENQEMTQKYEDRLAEWNEGIRKAEARLKTKKHEYKIQIKQWKIEKEEFEKIEKVRIQNLQQKRISNVGYMQTLLSERLSSIQWPNPVKTSFDIQENGQVLLLNIELPKIEDWPVPEKSKTKERKNYLVHIHSIGFRLLGEGFHILPSITTIILSGYINVPDSRTGQPKKSYLFSAKVIRQIWSTLNFNKLDWIDVVDCFEEFDIRRNKTASGIIKPIEPFGQIGE